MNRNNCVIRLRLCACEQTIARIEAVWKVFWVPTKLRSPSPGRGAA